MSLDFLQKTKEFEHLLQALEKEEKGLRVTGLIEPAKPYFLSCLAKKIQKRIVLIQPHSVSLSKWQEWCQFFLEEFSSDRILNILPALSENPCQEIFPSLDSISLRMKTFYGLRRGKLSLLITNLLGLLKPFPSPENLKGFFLELSRGESFARDRLLNMLEEFGYAQEDLIASPGEFAWRGGIVDVFSPWERFPFRVEFSGDEVASVREFDVSTQRSLRRIDHLVLPALREFPASPQFLREWEETALKAVGTASNDIREKIKLLESGELFPSFVYLSLLHSGHFVPFTRYLSDSLFIIDDLDEVEKQWEEAQKDFDQECRGLRESGKFFLSPEIVFPSGLWEKIKKEALLFQELTPVRGKRLFHFPFQSVPRFENKIPFFLDYLRKLQEEREQCFIYLSNQGLRLKMASLLSQNQVLAQESSTPFISHREAEAILLVGELDRGFSFPPEKITYFSEKDIFTEERVIISRPTRRPFLSQFQDLKEDDYVVHADYGIGIFKGLVKMDVDSRGREFIEINYRDDDKLFVPVEDLNLVQRYSAVGPAAPILDKLGTLNWQKTKERTKKAIENMARELLELYARRKALTGFAFTSAGAWESEFERTFEYEETEDQLKSIGEIEKDMESDSPMDRLVCGDVGYGKTEVAMRAAFKAVMDGKQVAVLCPTTVLASQHLKTFRNRMILFPIRVEALTRLQTKNEQAKIVEELKKGLIDIIIGTHRLLSKDVEFHDLGLLVVDEEQRFGVSHKEKTKQMKANIDVLTMTATPIPRTLNLSLSGLRDISLIETPPKDRLAVHTVVTTFSSSLVASALRQELGRDGQLYYIHNRVEDIDEVARRVQKLVPQAKPVVIHGKMSSVLLEKRMIDFINRQYNVLISTTIIENGIDIPLVNTLIVDRSDLFGLSQLYQLRGRVGRSSRQAYAYFLVPPFAELTPLAKQRLKALKEFSELGSGFRLAAKDLEIRGAGNLLGSQQHGYMEAVGFDYFMQLLEQTIKELKGEKVEEVKSEINLKVGIRIPEEYVPQINLRLNLYKRVSSIEDPEEVEKIRAEIKDRFGPLPPGVKNLLLYGVIKHLAQKLRVKTLDRLADRLILKFFPTSSADPQKMIRLIKKFSGSISPQGILMLSLPAKSDEAFLNETIFALKELSGYTIIN